MTKKLLLSALFLFLTLPFFAQTRAFEVNLPDGETETKNVGNFTIIDSDGISWTLWSELDKGRTIFIDIFSAT